MNPASLEPRIEPAIARAILARVGEIGQPPDAGIEHLNTGNESILGVLEREYIAPMAESRRGSAFKLVQAYFGGGKTHFLYAVRALAWRYGFASAVVGLSPEECPFDDPVRIFRAVAAELSWPPQGTPQGAPPEPSSPPARGIEAALRVALEERVEQAGAEAVEAWIAAELRRTSMDSPSFRAAVVGYLLALLHEDPAREDLLGAFLRGEELSLAELRPFGVRELLARESGFRFLRSLCQVVQALGCPGLLLCFDELDRNLSLPPRRRRAVADNLRQLIDLTGREALPGLLCLYAVPPEFMRNVVVEYPALQQRLEGPSMLSARSPQAAVIDLEHLDLAPQPLLVAIGLRLLALFEAAHDAGLDPALQLQNLEVLADEVLASSFEVAHRRAFVKAAVELLHRQTAAEGLLTPAEARSLAGQGGEVVALGVGDGFEVF